MAISKKHSELIKAWLDGADIQYLERGSSGPLWIDTERPLFTDIVNYRIKPKPKEKRLVPFDFNDWVGNIGKVVRSKIGNKVFVLRGFTEVYAYIGGSPISYDALKSNYEFIDGSVCGKYIEE